MAYFRQQGPQRKLISSTNVVATTDTDAPWARVSEGSVALRLGGQIVLARQLVLRATALGLTAEAPRLRLWQFFWVNGHLTASPMKAKLLGALEMARGHGDDGAIVTLYALDEGDTQRVLEAFVQTHGEALLDALRATRGQD
jgi:EpsI family protein